MSNLIITPKTKVGQLLEAYPHLESVLLEISPAFAKLKNPVLRKTVARIATLQQAAMVGNVSVGLLVNRLRKAVGQEVLTETGEFMVIPQKPEWFRPEFVQSTVEIAALLESGQQPVHTVLGALKNLEQGKVLEIVAPFVPAPLLEKAESIGFKYWINQESESLFRVYFCKLD